MAAAPAALLASCFLFLLLGAHGAAAQPATLLPQLEVDALKSIARKLKVNWDFSVDPCSGLKGWQNSTWKIISNVTCDCSFNNGEVCHVVNLQLMRQNLTGLLPEEIVNLSHLRYLDLSRNLFTGSIPPSWASLPAFNISLQGNRLTGRIPKEFGSMSALLSLQLEANHLEGPIPPELGDILTLQRFFISANKITGELPSTFSKLINMTDFRVDGNSISGEIPSFIKSWQQVNRIDMQGTAMIGPIPSSISFLRNLTELRVTDISGPSMPFPELQNAYHLTELVLRNCSITGELPAYLGQMKWLKVLDLSFNKFTGKIPPNFEVLAAQGTLQYLYLTNNMFTGDIPPWMLRNKASNKVNMDISYNNFTGNAPTECQQANINMVATFSSSALNLPQPCLWKNIPCTGPKYSSIFINCGGKRVVVDNNEYEDDSTQIGTSTFYLSDNKRWAYSSTGDFVGDEDADYIARNTSKLLMPDTDLYTEARLSPLSLKYYGLCLENGDYQVRLHFAENVFTADQTYNSNGERIFDVFIQGVKVLSDFNIEDEAGGPGRELIKNFTATVKDNTLEIHFYWAGKGTTAIPDRGTYGPLISAISVQGTSSSDHVPAWVIAIIIIACCVLASLLVFLCIKCTYLRKGWRKFINLERTTALSDLQTRAQYLFSMMEIEAATGNFDPKNKLGEGGFGPVYKGILADGTTVAVKQLSSKSSQGNREFLNEIGIISTLRHPNLVKLFGCCIDGDQLMVIYEYMENNSLARALFGRPEHQLKLDWHTRYNICLGTAKGLAYLHEESPLKIVHRDIKASNILLDKHLHPKISDFGLAKLNDECDQFSSRIAGTIGYMAPEYATRGLLTHKADVYSFGVVTLELVSGRINTKSMPNEEFVFLLDWAQELQSKNALLEMVDSELGSKYPEQEVLRVLNIALLCTSTSPARRPTMSAVVHMLTGAAPVEVSPVNDQQERWRQPSLSESQMDWSCSGSSYSSANPNSNPRSGYIPSSGAVSQKI